MTARPPCFQCGAVGPHIKGCKRDPSNAPTVKGVRILMRGGLPKIDWVVVLKRTKATITYSYHGHKYTEPIHTIIIPRHDIDEADCREVERKAFTINKELQGLKVSIALLKGRIYGDIPIQEEAP